MQLPIIVCDDTDVLLFKSVADAETYLEAMDVENDVYIAFDREGYVVDLWVEADRVHLALREPAEQQVHAVHRKLTFYLRYFKVNADWIASATLENLVTKVAEISS